MLLTLAHWEPKENTGNRNSIMSFSKVASDNYLNEDLRDFAEININETVKIKEEALLSFKEWIEKQQYFKNCPTDNRFLLRFLRATKFDASKAQECLTVFLTLRFCQSQIYTNLNPTETKVDILLKKGLFCPLQERDLNNRAVLFTKFSVFDPDIDPFVAIRAYQTTAEIMLMNAENQIHGITLLCDFENCSGKYLAIFKPQIIYNFMKYHFKISIMSMKLYTYINFSGPFQVISNKIINQMPDNISKKFFMSSSMEIHESIPKNIIPKEHGGTGPSLQHFIDAFTKTRQSYNGDLYAHLSPIVFDPSWKRLREQEMADDTLEMNKTIEID